MSKVACKGNCTLGNNDNLNFYMLWFTCYGDILGMADRKHGVEGRAETKMEIVITDVRG